MVVDGEERLVDAAGATRRGLGVVDLSDGWAPRVFQDGVAADGTPLPNRYRTVFVGLASDRTDGDGQPLRAGEKNFLELYGVPPTLSVLRERFLEHGARACDRDVDRGKLLAVDEIPTWGATTEKKELAVAARRHERLQVEREKAQVASLEDLAAAVPRLAKDVMAHGRFQAERAAFAEVEKRLACEGLMDPARHVPGTYDTVMRHAMLDFQQRHAVMAQGDITRGTLEALARGLVENDFLALERVLRERAAHAGPFLEDGSVPERPDLVGEATRATMVRMGVGTPEDALRFFSRRTALDFTWLKVVVRLPPAPGYHASRMDLVAEIDRGDVWYDFPYDAKGRRLPQPRRRYPTFTLYARVGGERLPLVRWRTTIGGWRSELAADGQEYLRYKDSDVGPRVWRHVVAGPVWIPPPSSPLGGMVKTKWVNGAHVPVTNYDETGPGYLSAYGLVAAIHVDLRRHAGGRTTYFDNGIRTHGSFDYMSLRGRFSHGCHRLANNLAVRLFSFVLARRSVKVVGPVALDARRTFWHGGRVFDLRLPTRGFYYELDPPLPVETLEGTIQGVLRKAPQGYVRRPGVEYLTAAPPAASADPGEKAGGGAAAASGARDVLPGGEVAGAGNPDEAPGGGAGQGADPGATP